MSLSVRVEEGQIHLGSRSGRYCIVIREVLCCAAVKAVTAASMPDTQDSGDVAEVETYRPLAARI